MNQIIEDFKNQILHPQSLIQKRFDYVFKGGEEFINMLKTQDIQLHHSKTEQMTGFTNLMVSVLCIFSVFVLLLLSCKKISLCVRKYIMMFFYSMLSIATLTGFFVHAFELKENAYNGMWTVLYVMMIIAVGIRFFQAFVEISFITGILMLPLIVITGYIDIIACWHFDLFVCIGLYVVLFGVVMCIIHFVMIFTRGVHYMSYILADVAAIASIAVQVSSIKVGDWDKNAFFHLGVAIYVFFNTIALIIVTVVERNKDVKKVVEEKEKKE